MKKFRYFKTILISVMLVLSMTAFAYGADGTDPQCTYMEGRNINYQNYGQWASCIGSYMTYENGEYMRVQAGSNGAFTLFYYDDNFKMLRRKDMSAELPIFGAFYDDGSNYYIVSGQMNKDESDSCEVFRVTKFDKNWNRLGSCGLYGANTYIPFDAGSCRMDKSGKYMIIHTAHEMYASSDGLHHQANVTIQVDTDAMKVTDSYTGVMNYSYGYISHSFNQFVKIENNKIVAVDHGDSHLREITLLTYPTDITSGKFQSGNVTCTTAFAIGGTYNDNHNYTGATAGGFEISSSSYLIAGSSVVQDSDFASRSTHNVFVSVIDRSTKAAEVKWLTNYAEGETTATTPHLVKINDNSFAVLWTQGSSVKYVMIDGKGNKTSQIYEFEGSLSDCAPVLHNNNIVWYTYDGPQETLYSIPLSSPGRPDIKSHTQGHTYEPTSINKETGSAEMKCTKCGAETNACVPTSITVWWKKTGNSGLYSSLTPSGLEAGASVDCWIEPSYNADVQASADIVLDEMVIEPSDAESCVVDYDAETITFNKAGTYTITIYPKYNPDLKVTRKITIVKPLESVSLETEGDLNCGSTVRLTAVPEGGKGSLQYKFTMTDPDGTESVLRDYNSYSYYSWKPAKVGQYTLQAEVKDQGDGDKVVSSEKKTIEILPQKTVVRGGREITAASELTYGDKLSELSVLNAQFTPANSTTILTGTFTVGDPDEILPAGSHEVPWKFVPDDSNYAELTGTVSVVVKKAQPSVTEVPSAEPAVYSPSLTLENIELSGGAAEVNGSEVSGEWAWKDPETVPADGASYTAVFAPDDTDNYESAEAGVKVSVSKAVPYVYSLEAGSITYGSSLADSALTGVAHCSADDSAAVDGTFAWADDSVRPQVSDSQKTEYSVVFTPDDQEHYVPVTTVATLTVEKAEIPAVVPQKEMTVPYYFDTIDNAMLAAYPGWEFSPEAAGAPLAVGEPFEAVVRYTADDKDNYKTTEVRTVVTRKNCSHENITWVDAEPFYCMDKNVTGYWYCDECKGFYTDRSASEYMILKAHVLTHHSYAAPSCTETGASEYWQCEVCGRCFESETADNEISAGDIEIAATGHSWDAGVVTKEATTEEAGEILYTCTVCGETRTEVIEKLPDPEKQMGSDGTPVGAGASEQAAEKAITEMKTDSDPKGSVFGLLQLRSPKQTTKSVKLSWKKVPGAAKYVIYGNKCGKTNRMIRQTAVTGASYNYTKAKKGTYYKFIVVAVDKEGTVLSTSKVVHVAAKGGKVGNHKSVTTKAKKDKVTIKKGKTFKLGAKAIAASKKLKVKKHRGLAYESSNPGVAAVSSKGVIKGNKKGTCYVYVYAQNGVFRKIKVTVK